MKRLHRWLGLVFALFWLVQATSGVLIAFRWEADDAMIAGPAVAVDPAALGRRIEALEQNGADVSSMWASGGADDRFDIYHQVGGDSLTMRVDGGGNALRTRNQDERFAAGGFLATMANLHQNLLADDLGEWIIGISGVLLLTNIVSGLKIAWPRGGRWAAALRRRPAGSAIARTYGWHRLLGLWIAIPAILVITTGTLLVFEHGVESAIGGELPEARAAAPGRGIDHAEAMRRALSRYPGSTIAGFTLPEDDTNTYRVRLLVPGETNRIFGATTLVLSGADGSILLDHDARQSRGGRWWMETLYPLHTGQIGGTIGRVLLMLIGLWLATMVVLGVRLWQRRRPKAGLRRAKADPHGSEDREAQAET